MTTKVTKKLVFVLVLLFVAPFVQAQIDERATELINKATEFYGGDALRNLKTLKSVDAYTQVDPQGNPQVTLILVSYMDFVGGRVRVETFTQDGGTLLQIQQYNGDDSFAWTEAQGRTPVAAAMASTLKDSFYQGWIGLKHRSTLRERLEFREGEDLNAVITTTAGVTVSYFIEPTGELAAEIITDPQTGTVTLYYSDLLEVGGVRLPRYANFYQGDVFVGAGETLQTEINVPLEDAFSTLP